MLDTVDEQCLLSVTASFNRDKFPIEDEDHFGGPVPMSTEINIDAIHNIILSDPRIGLKQSH